MEIDQLCRQVFDPFQKLLGTTALLFLISEPPKFTRTPPRTSVTRLGQNKVFECQVTGTPEIDIYWFKEGSEIQPSERYQMSFANSVASLEVLGTDAKDSGLYYCEARNEAGSESCSMELKVKGWFPLKRILLLLFRVLILVLQNRDNLSVENLGRFRSSNMFKQTKSTDKSLFSSSHLRNTNNYSRSFSG